MHGMAIDNQNPLSEVRSGQRVRVTRCDGGKRLRERLCAMGLAPGVSVEVACDNGGPVILSVFGSRLMIGRGMAAKIMVRLV
ncbi:MAG: FeoA family protein [Phycisphaerae bacterium]